MIQTLVQTFMVPALRKLREERGTRFEGEANEIKGRATRPATVNGTVMGNTKTRLAEAYTTTASSCNKTSIVVDEGYSYSARGEITDAWESTPHSGGYYHPTAGYWESGGLKTLWISTLPVITYGADGEGRTSTVSASTGQNPVTSTNYNTAGQVTGVTFGSGDSDAFSFDGSTGRMTQYKYMINGSSEIGNLTWNPNASLKTLGITDPFNAGDAQTCNYAHDDLARVASANCGTPWSQTFSYDAFGNVTKNGSITWIPGYNASTNRYTLAGTSYDSNGNLLADTFHSYTWDTEGNPATIDAIGLTYDAFDRVVEQNQSGTYYQVVYTPQGGKLGLFNAQVIQQLYIPLPGGAKAEYLSWGLSHYRHADWLGSDRLESSTTRTILDDNAYAPFGEPYAQTGNGEISFTGQNKDTDWLQYDFLFRQYDPKQGRWISADRAGLAVTDPTNPQSWNRYTYVANNPLREADPLGFGVDANGNCTEDDSTTCVSASPDPTDPNPGGRPCPGSTGWLVVTTPNGTYLACYAPGGQAPQVPACAYSGSCGPGSNTGSNSDNHPGLAIFHNNPNCAHCGDLWKQADCTLNGTLNDEAGGLADTAATAAATGAISAGSAGTQVTKGVLKELGTAFTELAGILEYGKVMLKIGYNMVAGCQ